jgi:hypothetical protein
MGEGEYQTRVWVKEVLECDGGRSNIVIIGLEAAIQARSDLTIPLQPGPF